MTPGGPDKPVATDVEVHVTVEAVAWVTRFLGGDGSRRVVFDEAVESGDTIRTVLRRLSGRYPELDQALWDPKGGDLGEHIEVLVNDAVLGLTHTLDSAVKAGDRISLFGQYMGG